MAEIYYTADLHLEDKTVAGHRGYPSAAAHDERVVHTLAATLRKGDILWNLGDTNRGGNAARQTAAIATLAALRDTIGFHHHLIPGNHCGCHPMHRDAHNWQGRYLAAFDSVQAFARHRIAGHDVMLSHFPYTGDHTTPDRHTQYRLRDEGRALIHGHTHQQAPQVPTRPREVCVSLEAWHGQLVHRDTLAATLAAMEGAGHLPPYTTSK